MNVCNNATSVDMFEKHIVGGMSASPCIVIYVLVLGSVILVILMSELQTLLDRYQVTGKIIGLLSSVSKYSSQECPSVTSLSTDSEETESKGRLSVTSVCVEEYDEYESDDICVVIDEDCIKKYEDAQNNIGGDDDNHHEKIAFKNKSTRVSFDISPPKYYPDSHGKEARAHMCYSANDIAYFKQQIEFTISKLKKNHTYGGHPWNFDENRYCVRGLEKQLSQQWDSLNTLVLNRLYVKRAKEIKPKIHNVHDVYDYFRGEHDNDTIQKRVMDWQKNYKQRIRQQQRRKEREDLAMQSNNNNNISTTMITSTDDPYFQQLRSLSTEFSIRSISVEFSKEDRILARRRGMQDQIDAKVPVKKGSGSFLDLTNSVRDMDQDLSSNSESNRRSMRNLFLGDRSERSDEGLITITKSPSKTKRQRKSVVDWVKNFPSRHEGGISRNSNKQKSSKRSLRDWMKDWSERSSNYDDADEGEVRSSNRRRRSKNAVSFRNLINKTHLKT